MNDDYAPIPEPGSNDRPIEWSREPVASRLRALADNELPPAEATDLRNEMDAEAIARADSFERALRRGCASCMDTGAAPAGLRERVLDAMRAETEGADDGATPVHAKTASAPEVIRRTDRSFWTQGRALMGVAAAIALAAVVWVMAPSNAPTPDPSALLATAAQHVSGEHHGCTLDGSRFTNKMIDADASASDATRAAFISEQIGDLPVKLALGQAGYTLKGVGGCHVPGGKSVHLLYEPTDPQTARPVSLFIQHASSAHDWMTNGTVYLSGKDAAPYVRVWREESVVYYMVTECPVSCKKAEAAYALSGERVSL